MNFKRKPFCFPNESFISWVALSDLFLLININLFLSLQYGHSKIGHRSTELNGCYASHIILLPGTHVVKMPDNVPSTIAAPLNCALATMVNATTCIPTRMKSAALIQVK